MGVDKPNYTQIPNLILDDLIIYMSGAELKVTLAIARQTFGYHRERHPLTITELEQLTGLSRPAVVEAIDTGERRNLIKRERLDDGRWAYSLVINNDVLAVGKESLPEPVKKVNHIGKESLPPSVKKVYRSGNKTLPKSVKKVDQNTPVLKKEKETSKEREDDHLPPSHVMEAWLQHYGEPMPVQAREPISRLAEAHGPDAVIHGIEMAVAAKARTVAYIAKCARNYIPPASTPAPRYSVDTPGIISMPLVTNGHAPAPRPSPPVQHDDPWAIALSELSRELPLGHVPTLMESRAELVGQAANENGDMRPLYRVTVPVTRARGLDHFIAQCGPAIRRKLSSVLGKPVLVEIVAGEVAAEMEALS